MYSHIYSHTQVGFAVVDLNHRPLAYECNLKRNSNELAGVVGLVSKRGK
jgi:hypothetical protein